MKKSKHCSNLQKKQINNFLKVTDQFPCCQFAEKYLSVSFLMIYLNASKILQSKYFKTIFFLRISQVLPREIRVSNNLAISDEIQAFDCSPSFEVGGVFLDITKKDFNKVWHDGLLSRAYRVK